MKLNKTHLLRQLQNVPDFTNLLTRRELRYIPKILGENEQIHGLTYGFHEGNIWLVVVTSLRLVFLYKKMLFGLKQKDYSLEDIVSFSYRGGLPFGEIKFQNADGSKKAVKISHAKIHRIGDTISRLLSGSQPLERETFEKAVTLKMKRIANKLESLKEAAMMIRREIERKKRKRLHLG